MNALELTGRSARYAPALELIARGYAVKRAIEDCGLAWVTFHVDIAADPELQRAYETALQLQADVDADMAVDVAEDPNLEPARARLKSEALRWRAAIRNRRKYGTQVDLVVDTGPNVRAALALATQRVRSLRPIGDAAPPALPQTIDAEGWRTDLSTDSESVDESRALARLLGDAD